MPQLLEIQTIEDYTFNDFKQQPYRYWNKLTIRILGTDVNIFKHDDRLRRLVLFFAGFFTLVWIVMGFDSGTGMIEFPLTKLILGEARSWKELVYWYHWAYGKTMHFSAFTIYGLHYVAVSHLFREHLHMTQSKNSAYSFGLTLLNIALFEYFWIYGFAYFQDQWWVTKWQWPQIRILVQNLIFFVLGLIILFDLYLSYIRTDGEVFRVYRFKKWLPFLVCLVCTLAGMGYWIYMGTWYPYRGLSVEIDGYRGRDEGVVVWNNKPMFVQTLYTVDVNLSDSVNSGDWYYLEDDYIHLVNTVVKGLYGLTGVAFAYGWKLDDRLRGLMEDSI